LQYQANYSDRMSLLNFAVGACQIMTTRLNVLVFPCGAENALEIYDSLCHSLHVNLFGASSKEDYGRFLFKQYDGSIPYIGDIAFQSSLKGLIARWKIDIVFATHDSVAEHLAEIPNLGAYLVNGNVLTTKITRREFDWVPKVYRNLDDIHVWPIVVKPDCGQGAVGIAIARNRAEASAALQSTDEPVICEYLPGAEVTVDCFTNRNRTLIWDCARTRERVRAGISMRSMRLERDADIHEIAVRINQRLCLRGPWFFQVKKDVNEKWKLLEVSCRVSGTMVAQRATGVNLVLLAIHDYMSREVKPIYDDRIRLVERRITTVMRLDYEFHTIVIDYDDTIVHNGVAIPDVMRFLYCAIALGKKIILLTRHLGDLSRSLAQAHVSETLFDKIIQIDKFTLKSSFVPMGSIFIDNHFPERAEVAKLCKVPTFDIDAVQLIGM
jgi:hypothetical protein